MGPECRADMQGCPDVNYGRSGSILGIHPLGSSRREKA